ncbi:hypothetical protein ACKKBF_B36715 [Auxenochlorella protothecoides x Auxenochlorella symbiontica]
MFGAGSLAAAGRGSLPPLPSTPPKPIGFAYNERVAAALLPSLIILAGFDGGSMASILMVGGMAVYILDTLRQKEMAFGVAWATLGLALLAAASGKLFLASEMPGILAALVLLITAACLALTGLWISIQFRWIQLQYPVVVAGFEKTLIGGSFPVAAAVQSWALTVAAGVDAAPFLLVALLCTLYHLLALPLEPSLAPRGRGPRPGTAGPPSSAGTVQEPGEGAAAFFLVATLPAGMYAVAEAADLAHWVHAWSLLLLASLPLLAVACMPRGLWWLGAGERVRRLRAGLLLASLAAALAGLEARVVFRSYAQYLRLPPPWSYLAVTVAVYGAAALLLLHAVGALEPEVERAMAGPVLVVGAAVGALALGLPLWVMPAPLAAAAGLAGWAETRRAGDYGVFVLGTLLAAAWFLHHHFWFLEVRVAGYALRTLCLALGAGLALALLLAGGLHAPGAGRRAGWLRVGLVAQAALVAAAEAALTAGLPGGAARPGRPLYPPALVAATTAAGLALTARLAHAPWQRAPATWLMACLYASKAALLVLPRARLLGPMLGLALAATPPLLLFEGGPGRNARPPPGVTALLAAGCVAAVALARFAVFDVLRALGRRRPGEAALLGALLLLLCACLAPLVARWHAAEPAPRRALALLAGLGVLLLALRPPLPLAGGAACPPGLPLGLCPRLWDGGHIPAHEADAEGVYGSGLRRASHAPLWLLLAGAWLGLAAATAPGAGRGARVHGGEAAAAALALGVYVAAEHAPSAPLLQAIIVLSFLALAGVMVALSAPPRAAPAGAFLAGDESSGAPTAWPAAPLLAALWSLGFPLALLAAVAAGQRPVPERMAAAAARLFPDSARDAAAERAMALQAAVLAAWAAQAAVLALALKLRVERTRGGGVPAPRGAGALDGGRGGGARRLFAAADARLAAAGLAWAPPACNAAALLCVGCAGALGALGFAPAGGAAALAPALLLLTRDALTAPWLTPARRYLPPAALLALTLNGAAMLAHAQGARGWGDAVRAARDLAGGAALLAPQAWALAGLGSEKAQPLGRAALAALLGLCLGGGLLARSGELKALGAGTAVVLGLQAAEASRARAALHAAI